jgi:hypothetical protein
MGKKEGKSRGRKKSKVRALQGSRARRRLWREKFRFLRMLRFIYYCIVTETLDDLTDKSIAEKRFLSSEGYRLFLEII